MVARNSLTFSHIRGFFLNKKILFNILALLVLGGIFGGAYFFTQKSKLETFPANAHVALSIGVVPIGTLFSLTPAHTLEPVIAPGMPNAQVIDMISSGEKTFYLIGDSATRTSNLYLGEDGHLVRLTNSPTVKFALSYDPVSNSFAYLAGSVTGTNIKDFVSVPWKITLFDLTTKKERALPASGASPILLRGGMRIIAARGVELVAIDSQTGTSTEFAKRISGAPYAISNDSTMLAIYNPTTHAIDYFDMHTTLPNYVRSEPTSIRPVSLGFVGTRTLLVSVGDSNTSIFTFTLSGTALSFEIKNPLPLGFPQQLTTTYEK